MSDQKQFCEECGATLDGEDRFCPECGTAVPTPEKTAPAKPEPAPSRSLFCEECGASIKKRERFCQQCGAPADPAAKPSSSDSPAPPPIASGADEPVSRANDSQRGAPLALIIGGAVALLLFLGGGAFLASKLFGFQLDFLPGSASAARTTLKLDRQFVRIGETATVPIWLIDADSITQLQLTLSYDASSLEPSGAATAGSVAPGATIDVAPGEASTFKIAVRSDDGISGTGALVKIPFKVIGSDRVKRPLRLTVDGAASLTGEKPGIKVINGEVVVGNK